MKRKGLFFQTAGCVAVVFLFIAPLFRLIFMSLTQSSGYGLGNYAELLQQSRTLQAILNTIFIALASTGLSAVLGTMFAFLIAYTNIRHKKLLELLVLLPMILPSYVITLSWTSLFSQNGAASRFLQVLHFPTVNLYSLGGILFVLGLCNMPLVYLTAVETLRKIPKELEWAARAAGCGPWETLLRVNLVQASPAIIGGSVLAFLSCMDNFSVPAFLGIPASIPVLSTYIYEKAIGFGPDSFALAAALSVLLSAVAISGSVFMMFFARKIKRFDSIRPDFSDRIFWGDKVRRLVESCCIGLLGILDIVPLATMMISSFQDLYGQGFTLTGLSLKNYQFILTNSGVLHATVNSLFLALITCVACILLGTAAAYRKSRGGGIAVRLLELSSSLTYAIPGIVLALAMIFHWSMVPGVYGSIQILIIAYITRYLIIQIKGSSAAMLSVHPALEEAASVSGCGKVRKWKKLLVPLLFRQTVSSTLLIFVSALTEMTLSSILASAGTETIGLAIFNLQQSGDYNLADSFSVVIVFLILLSYGCIRYACREKKTQKEIPVRCEKKATHSRFNKALNKVEESTL